MASYIDLDSYYRDRDSYPNENDYYVQPEQVKNWVKQPRTTSSTSRGPQMRPLEFAVTIKIISIAVPYSVDIASFPRIYVDFRSQTYDDTRLIDCIDGRLPDSKFICNFDKIQYNSANVPTWIHYKCRMEQTMRFERGQPVFLRITGRSGIVLPQQDNPPEDNPDPTKQTLVTFRITPYDIEGDFSSVRHSQPLVL